MNKRQEAKDIAHTTDEVRTSANKHRKFYSVFSTVFLICLSCGLLLV